MNKIIIFDFNRTLYDPEAGRLMYGARAVLTTLRKRQFRLFLISTADQKRLGLIKRLSLTELFDEVVLVSAKSSRPFKRIIGRVNADVRQSFVVGDRVQHEIILGNRCGLRTVWLRRGKFRNELPQSPEQKPDYSIADIRDVLSII